MLRIFGHHDTSIYLPKSFYIHCIFQSSTLVAPYTTNLLLIKQNRAFMSLLYSLLILKWFLWRVEAWIQVKEPYSKQLLLNIVSFQHFLSTNISGIIYIVKLCPKIVLTNLSFEWEEKWVFYHRKVWWTLLD